MSFSFHQLKVIFSGGLLLIALSLAAFAQQTTGNVRGVVKDPSGAVVAGARVTLRDPQTNTALNTQSNGAGEYEFKTVPVGDYQITVEANGFKSLTLSGVRAYS
jgi:Carboxypeptidase regulatory-like domain